VRTTSGIAYGLLFALLAYACILAIMASSASTTAGGFGFWPSLYEKPVGEDGYYMLAVAWNFAATGTLAYNFGDVTTGIQPLATFVYALVAKAVQLFDGDKDTFARATIFFNGLLLVAFCLLIGRLARLVAAESSDPETAIRSRDVAIVLAATSFFLFRTFTYGLETGLYLVLLVALSTRVFKDRGIDQNVLGVGALCGLAGLARIDFGLVLAVFLGLILLFRAGSFRSAVLVGLIALAFVSPWLAFVYLQTGSVIPSSGGAQATLISAGDVSRRSLAMAAAVLQNAFPTLFVEVGRLASWVVTGLALLATLILTRKALSALRYPRALALLWLSFLSLPIAYFTFFWAVHFYDRYTTPLVIPVIVTLAILLARTVTRDDRVALLCGIAALAFVGLSGLSLHMGRPSWGFSIPAFYVKENYSAETYVIGAFQTGVLGYMNENVINLDGKIDSEALTRLRSGETHLYMDKRGVNVLVDWPELIEQQIPADYLAANFTPCPEPMVAGRAVCFVRKDAEP
jgi:hypothetical protein